MKNFPTTRIEIEGALPGPIPKWALLSILLLMFATIAAAPLGWSHIDSARDLFWALRISRGEEFPLAGPLIGFFVNLGPVWFYLLSIPLVLNASFTSAALGVGLIAALQYPLALWLGSRLLDWRLGLLWALLLAYPNLGTFSQVVLSHYTLSGTAVMAFFCAGYLHYRRPCWWTACLLGFTFSLAIHAHPTNIAYGLLLLWIIWTQSNRRISRWFWAVIGGLIPFLPLLFLQVEIGGSDLKAVAAFLEHDLALRRISQWPALMWHTITVGTGSAAKLATQSLPVFTKPLIITSVVLAGCAITGAILIVVGGANRRLWAWSTVGWAAWTLQVAVLREQSWWYMLLGGLPLLMLSTALSIRELGKRNTFSWILPSLSVLSPLSLLALFVTLLYIGKSGTPLYFPTSLLKDLKAPQTGTAELPSPALNHMDNDDMGVMLCESGKDLVLHGAIALQADTLGSMATDLHCRKTTGLYVSGRLREASHILGLGPSVLADLDIPAPRSLGSFGLFEPIRVLHPKSPVPMASARNYLPRQWSGSGKRVITISFKAASQELVALSNPMLWWWSVSSTKVTVNGGPANLLAQDAVTAVYGCRNCSDDKYLLWKIHLRAGDGYEPDVVTFRRDNIR